MPPVGPLLHELIDSNAIKKRTIVKGNFIIKCAHTTRAGVKDCKYVVKTWSSYEEREIYH